MFAYQRDMTKSGGFCQQVQSDPNGRKSVQLKNCYAFDNLCRFFPCVKI